MTEREITAILGVGPGLGLALAHRFAREGHAVALMARSAPNTEAMSHEIRNSGGEAIGIAVDGTRPDSVTAAFQAVRDRLGPPGVLVYNAGAFQPGGLLEIDPGAFEQCWKVNCMGAFLAARSVLPDMLSAGRGTLLLTGATAALRGSARFANLAVGKFGLRALAQSMAREFGPAGIHVAHIIIDGQIETPQLRSAAPDRRPETTLAPAAIAETYWQLHCQEPRAWTLELDLRPAVERF